MNILGVYIAVFLSVALLVSIAGNYRTPVMVENKLSHYELKRSGFPFLLLGTVMLGLFYGLRSYNVGVDSLPYVVRMGGSFWDLVQNGAIGYAAVVVLFKAIFPGSYTAVFLFFGLVTAYCLLKSICVLCPKPFFGVLIIGSFGYLFEGVNQFRQLAAMSIVMLSVTHLLRRKNKSFGVAMLAAVSIHPSAAVFLVILFFIKVDFSDTSLLLAGVLTAVFAVIMPSLRGIFASLPVFGSYVGSEFDQSADVASILNFIFRLSLFMLLATRRGKLRRQFAWSEFFLAVALLGTVFQAFTLGFSMFARISSYFVIFYSISIPCYILSFDIPNLRTLIHMCLSIIFCVLFAVNATIKFSGDDYRYQLFSDETIRLSVR